MWIESSSHSIEGIDLLFIEKKFIGQIDKKYTHSPYRESKDQSPHDNFLKKY